MRLKVLALLGALALVGPVAAEAAPAGALTANGYGTLAAAPRAAVDASVAPGDAPAKVDKVWYRGRFGYGRGFGGRRFGFGYRRFGLYRPYYGYYRRPFFRRRFFY